MIVERGNRIELGSCNFCQRGEIKKSGFYGTTLVYPYEKVTSFCNEEGGGLKANICDKCLDELHSKSKMEQL